MVSSIVANNPRWLAPEVILHQARNCYGLRLVEGVILGKDGELCPQVSITTLTCGAPPHHHIGRRTGRPMP